MNFINWDAIYNYLFFAAVMVLYGEFRALISRRIYDWHQWKHHLPKEYKDNLKSRDTTIKKQKHEIAVWKDRFEHERRTTLSMVKIGLSELKESK